MSPWLGPKKAPPGRGHTEFDFRDGIEGFPSLTLYGPGAETVAKMDAQGLRASLPAGRGDTRPVGVELSQRLRGDLRILLGYELIAVGPDVHKYGAGVVMRVWFDALTPLAAAALAVWLYARQRRGAGWKAVPAPAQAENPEMEAAPAAIKVRCPQCGRTSKAGAALAGKKVKCPQCGLAVLVPEAGPGLPPS